MKRILIVALILILPSFYTVSACSPSGGDYWFTYDTKIETDDLPVGLTIRQDGEKYYINNSSVSNVDIYSDIGSANSTYYRLNNDNVFESTLFTKWKQIELPRGQGLDLTPIVTTQYYKSISKAEDLPAGEYLPNKLGDSRPENIKVPDPITFKIPYFSIDKSGELNVILTFKLKYQ